ncbi:hypothetical protein, partial [Brevibacillus agri]|uniref:hypothetical protein n=1 Tax=Brevibacillus agri TaxID=51101 RepID=UPI002E1C6102|nr:hypothetical protein [Brevibacillus agri]MED1730112.1 hypothetical protein [Brevibacillus agri]
FEFGWSVNQPYKKVKNYARGRSSTFNGEELLNWLKNAFLELEKYCIALVHFKVRSTKREIERVGIKVA